jgi:hypothetical protein
LAKIGIGYISCYSGDKKFAAYDINKYDINRKL